MSRSNQWVITTNINDFKDKLRAETDPDKRRVLERLLATEEEKLRRSSEPG
jgi:hypothetical protein